MSNSSSLPLVSVLIRSMDRPTLPVAIASVVEQSYSAIEIVVVNAKDSEHSDIEPTCGHRTMRWVNQYGHRAFDRAAAANAALNAARGEFLLFLDDDDVLLPEHIEKLARALRARAQYSACYTGVFCHVKETDTGWNFDSPFDLGRLITGNYIPIHALMFRRSLLAQGCLFDEQLGLYEDWDFWLQLLAHGEFFYVPGVSAIYRIHTSSGIHDDSGQRDSARYRVWRRWRQRSSDPQFLKAMQAFEACYIDRQTLREQGTEQVRLFKQENAHLTQTLAAERQAHQQTQQVLDGMLQSTSWKITAPLRKLMARWRAWKTQRTKKTPAKLPKKP